MAHDSGDRFVVLHALRVRTLASPDGLADATGLAGAVVGRILDDLAADGLAAHRGGVRPGWVLTPAGRDHHAEAADRDVRECGAADALGAAYRRFLELNAEVLAACAAWQLRDDGPAVPNDHTDIAYDARIIARLLALHRRASPVVADLSAAMSRFARYGARLERAIGRVVDGDADWFTRPTTDSYHTVWFELHEDLLRTLGIERGSEHSWPSGRNSPQSPDRLGPGSGGSAA